MTVGACVLDWFRGVGREGVAWIAVWVFILLCSIILLEFGSRFGNGRIAYGSRGQSVHRMCPHFVHSFVLPKNKVEHS